MQSPSSSRLCTAHFTGGNLLLLMLHCLLAKPLLKPPLKTATFLPISYPFPVQHVLLAVVCLYGPEAGQSQFLCACRAAPRVGTGALQELLPLPPKGLPVSILLTPD